LPRGLFISHRFHRLTQITRVARTDTDSLGHGLTRIPAFAGTGERLGIAERDGRELGTNPFDFAPLGFARDRQDKLAFIRFIILLASRDGIS